jgi:hypothetical protein
MFSALARVRAHLFIAAGVLMMISVVLIAASHLPDANIPQASFALPAMGAQITCILGLLALYPALSAATLLSRAGALAAWAAGAIMIGGIAMVATAGDNAPALIHGVGYAYTVAVSLAFALTSGAAFVISGPRNALAYLLLAPALIWLPIVIVGATASFAQALSLDLYTNALVSLVLLALGWTLHRAR